MKNYHSEKITINDSQLDCRNKVSMCELVKMIQTATYSHSQKIGLDHKSMLKDSGAFWVVSKLKLKIVGEIKPQDKIAVSTWTRPLSLIRALRDSAIKTKNRVLVKAVAEWCCLDYKTKTIRKLNSIHYPKLEMRKTKYHNMDFSKFSEVGDMDHVYTKQVLVGDIDMNLHTNNLKYINMAMDAFSFDEISRLKICEFEIHFVNQSYYGDEIKIYKFQNKKQHIIIGKVEGKTIFKVLIKTKPCSN